MNSETQILSSTTSMPAVQSDLEPSRIVILRALNLGDLVIAVPALRAFRRQFPKAEITLIGLPWMRQIVDNLRPFIDRLEEFPGFTGMPEVPYEPDRTDDFFREQRERGYDLAVQMHGSGEHSNRFVARLGARRCIGYGQAPDYVSDLDVWLPYPDQEHERDRNLGLAVAAGCANPDPRLEFVVTAEDENDAEQLLGSEWYRSTEMTIVAHPGAQAPARRWPPDRFASVLESLTRSNNGVVVLVGSSGERDLAEAVREQVGHDDDTRQKFLNLAGKTSVGGLAAVLTHASLFIGNDSGPFHLAQAMGVPAVALFGPGLPHRWGALDPKVSRVIRGELADGKREVSTITPDQVLDAALNLLRSSDQLNGQGLRREAFSCVA